MPAETPRLELTLPAADVPALLRVKELRGRRPSGLRAARVGLVWHDTPEGDLAADGIALAQYTDTTVPCWRSERLVPDSTEIWPPGAPAPLLREADAPPDSAGAPLLPIAAFEGHRRTLMTPDTVRAANAATGVVLLQGTLRAVAATQPVCRLLLSGPGAPDLALAWAGQIRLTAPPLSLAAEAATLAGRLLPSRPLGAPSLSAEQSVSAAFAFIVAHLAGVILHHAPAARDGKTGPEPVHQMRVALRRLRSAIALFRRATSCPQIEDASQRLKELGLVLGPARDWDVFTGGTGARIRESFTGERAIATLLAAAEARRKAGYAALAAYLGSPAWRELGIVLAGLAVARPWERFTPEDSELADKQASQQTMPLPDFAAKALRRRYDAVIAPGRDLSGLPVEALHDIRLHAKRLRYAAEFFAPLFPGRATRRFLRRMAALQEELGLMNDGVVAAKLMAALPGRGPAHGYAVGVVRGFVAARATGGRRKVEKIWHRFLKQEPFWG